MTRFMPVRAGTYQISSPFGQRGGGMHWGTDFAAQDGTKIYAAQAGTVVHIGRADGFGQWIVIDHPEEAGSGTTVYGHMWDAHATGLRQGEQVAAGQHIAFVGNNGESSGPHVHFEVHPTGDYRVTVDPMPEAKPARGGIAGASGYRYWTMSVTNLQEITDAVAAAGYKVRIPVMEIAPGTKISMVEDPDGNWVEFLDRD